MYGSSINAMHVYREDLHRNGSMVIVWSRRYDQGNRWRRGLVTSQLQTGGVYRFWIEALTGRSDEGDIAIDDLAFYSGACHTQHHANECDFEDKNVCGFVNDESDRNDRNEKMMKWLRLSEPLQDHTIKDGSGHYMSTRFGSSSTGRKRAVLASPSHTPISRDNVDDSSNLDAQWCVQLWYLAHGAHVAELNVYAQEVTTTTTPRRRRLIFSTSGNQGIEWHMLQANFFTSPKAAFRILIESRSIY